MKLDPKIKANAIIGHCFNTGEMTKYIGQVCYFVDALEDFSDLINPFEGVLKAVSPDVTVCYVAEAKVNGSPVEFPYCFCLPAEFVKEEKQYRPYSIEDFAISEFVVFRERNNPSMEYHVRYNGYRKCDNVYKVILGNISYTLSDLFEDFEYLDSDGKWVPFGVEEE